MSFRMILNRFSRTASVMDLRPDESTRYHRARSFALKHKTCGKPATFGV